jgi:inorganic pyrophosphatase
MNFKNMDTDGIAIGQLVVWDGRLAMGEYRSSVEKTMHNKSADWFVNIVSISEGKSYFMCSNSAIQQWAERVLGATFTKRLAEANRLWLRKEIFKQDQAFVS